ncbi:MAG: DUF1259 domain-containing protein [Gammaproteobacteria bacterium]|nr:DUF1259 domain-containing protein [Gammaproteobacteria bacterium]
MKTPHDLFAKKTLLSGRTLIGLWLIGVLTVCGVTVVPAAGGTPALDAAAIGRAAGTKAVTGPDGVVHIGWVRNDVAVTVSGMQLPPAAGLGTWAAFQNTPRGALVMGDTVVFGDEIDAAMDAAFSHGLAVTALHNHFSFDRPKVYFMHIMGRGDPVTLAEDVRAVWGAIRAVRRAHPVPAQGFGGPTPVVGTINAGLVARIVGHPAGRFGHVVKVTIGRTVRMDGVEVGGGMGLTTWAAFTGDDRLAAMDGDFLMRADEVQPVLQALRAGGIHIVALHTHMIGEEPVAYFTHFWGTGPVKSLAQAFRGALDAQARAGAPADK